MMQQCNMLTASIYTDYYAVIYSIYTTPIHHMNAETPADFLQSSWLSFTGVKYKI